MIILQIAINMNKKRESTMNQEERNIFYFETNTKNNDIHLHLTEKKRGEKLCMITGSLNESSSLVPCCGFHTALRPPALSSGVKLHRKRMC